MRIGGYRRAASLGAPKVDERTEKFEHGVDGAAIERRRRRRAVVSRHDREDSIGGEDRVALDSAGLPTMMERSDSVEALIKQKEKKRVGQLWTISSSAAMTTSALGPMSVFSTCASPARTFRANSSF